MSRRATTLAVLATALLLTAAPARAEERRCRVRYVSAEHVYLDAGRAAGLETGLTVQLQRDGALVAELTVVFVAEYSASCRMEATESAPRPGDEAVYETITAADPSGDEATAPPDPARRRRPAADGPDRPRTPVGAALRVTGSVALDWEGEVGDDDAPGHTSPGVSYNLRLRGLGDGLELRARGSHRFLSRARSGPTPPDDAWRHRFRELALVREGDDHAWDFAVGRVGVRAAAAAGPFDGLSVGRRLSASWRAGLFAGFDPGWREIEPATNDRLAGVSLAYRKRGDDGGTLRMDLAGVGRYHGGEVSREYLALSGGWRDGGRWSVHHAAQLDWNRGWRKARDGRTWRLGNVMLSARCRVDDRLILDAGLDDREPVRDWRHRSLPDSLFRDAGRRGARAGVTWRPADGLRARLSGALRRDDRDGTDTKSCRAELSLRDWPRPAVDLAFSLRGYAGPRLSGWAPRVSLTLDTHRAGRLRCEGGLSSYTAEGLSDRRTNRWLGAAWDRDLARRWSLALDYRREWGTDPGGHRWYASLRRRL